MMCRIKKIMHENTPTIETERLILRKAAEADIPAFLEILSDEEANAFLPWFPIKTIEEIQTFLQTNYLSWYRSPSAYRYAICQKEDNIPIGYINLGKGNSYDFGYGLRKEYWHKGIVTEAAKVVIERIKNAGYQYITSTHDINNPRSGEVMKKLGMSYRYSYVEQWQPKNFPVTFKMFQLNFDAENVQTYMEYWNTYKNHFI